MVRFASFNSRFAKLQNWSNLDARPRIQEFMALVRDDEPASPERKALIVDQRLQKLMQELGEAINESISDSDQIAEVIAKIKTGGYDVFLVLEATIGFNRRDEEGEPVATTAVDSSHDPELRVNQQDVKFLKSLRITLEGEDRVP